MDICITKVANVKRIKGLEGMNRSDTEVSVSYFLFGIFQAAHVALLFLFALATCISTGLATASKIADRSNVRGIAC